MLGFASTRPSGDFAILAVAATRPVGFVACDPCVVQRLVCATAEGVWDAWRLDPYVRGELHTYMCVSGSPVSAETSAVVAIGLDRLSYATKHKHKHKNIYSTLGKMLRETG